MMAHRSVAPESILADARAIGLPRIRREWSAGRPYRTIPGFAESLRALLFTEGYSFVDIGLMFGMSREMVRLAASSCGIAWNGEEVLRGQWPRRWDDEAHRFRPIPRAELDKIEQAERRAKKVDTRATKRTRIIEMLRAAQAKQDEPLSILEMARACGFAGENQLQAAPWLINAWGRARKVAGALAEIRAAAGLTARDVGGRGHSKDRPRNRKTSPERAARNRAIIAMRAGGMRYHEIAKILGMPIGTVGNVVHAARRSQCPDTARAS